MNAAASVVVPHVASAQACVNSAECNAPLQCVDGTCVVPAQPTPGAAIAPTPVLAPAPVAAPVTYSVAPQPQPAPVVYQVQYAPPPPPPPPPMPEGRGNFFEHGYFSVEAQFALGGWGGFSDTTNYDDDFGDDFSDSEPESITSKVGMAHTMRFGAMFAATRGFHIGGFVSTGKLTQVYDLDLDEDYEYPDESGYYKETQELLNWGAALKAGGGVGRAFLAFALDIGVATMNVDFDEAPAQHGLWLHPAFSVDVMAVRESPFKAAVHFSFGPAITVTGGDTDPSGDFTGLHWNVLPMLALGGNFGG